MREEKRILNVLSQVDEKYIDEAAPKNSLSKNFVWIKWASIVACLVLVVLCIGAIQGGWFTSNEIAKRGNRATISVVKKNATTASL